MITSAKALAVAAEPFGGPQLIRAKLETGDALDDVVSEMRLAELAIIDDVEPDLGLLLDDLRDGAPQDILIHFLGF